MWIDLSQWRIVATAVFDADTGRVIVAGQVLDEQRGVEGVAVRITCPAGRACARTGSLGSFGTAVVGNDGAIGGQVTVEVVAAAVTCEVR